MNRNYPINWKKAGNRINTPRRESYKGSKSASEKETKIMMNRVNELNPNAVISYHSTGSIIYWNFIQTGKLQRDCKNLFTIANSLTGYKDAEPNISKNDTLSPCYGDWVCAVKKIPALTIETGTNACPLEIDEFSHIWKENKHMLPAVAFWTLQPGKTSITKISSKETSFKVKWEEKNFSGYQIRYATRKDMSNAKYLTIDDKETVSTKIENLKSNKKYYVQVRVFRKTRDTKFYSKWSAKQIITTK